MLGKQLNAEELKKMDGFQVWVSNPYSLEDGVGIFTVKVNKTVEIEDEGVFTGVLEDNEGRYWVIERDTCFFCLVYEYQEDKFLLRAKQTRYKGQLVWRANNGGYTSNIDEAARYAKAAAMEYKDRKTIPMTEESAYEMMKFIERLPGVIEENGFDLIDAISIMKKRKRLFV